MVASCCVPTIFTPMKYACMTCFDGGVAHEAPFDPWLEDDGVDAIILHSIVHRGSVHPKVIPLNLIKVTAQAHA
jgi:predicted acylesterase/phospholipase RssA